jgi:hypothetical protein
MMNTMRLLLLLFLISTVGCVVEEPIPQDVPPTPAPREQMDLDLDDFDDNQLAWLKTRGSLDPEEDVFFYWTGSIYLLQDAAPEAPAFTEFPGPILHFEGFNVARFTPLEDGVRMVSREMAVYKSPYGNILECWSNSALDVPSPKQVPVVHVWNDPVSHTLYGADFDRMGDEIVFRTEIQLNYPSPLPVDDYPQYSANNTYQSIELFNWYVDLDDLQDPNIDNAPVSISWSRQGQALPWMQAGQSSAKLVYHTRGRKLLGGFKDLPEHIQSYVLEHGPDYQESPSSDWGPNMTSWRTFKSLIDSGAYSPDCN